MLSISKRYAQALFELSLEHHGLDQVQQDLSQLKNLLDTVPDFKKFINQVTITQDQFQNFFKTISKTLKFSNLTVNFLQLVGLKKRQNYLFSILNDFQELVRIHQSEAKVQVKTAYPLSSEQHQLLIETLEKHFNKRMILEEDVDPTLMSGIVIDCEGFRIDTSIKTQLAQWQNKIRV